MSGLCVDASVIVKLVLQREQDRAKANRLVYDLAAGNSLFAPLFFVSEVDSVLHRG